MRRKKADILRQFPIGSAAYEQLRRWSPKQKYVAWMVQRVHEKEDITKVTAVVANFHDRVERLPKNRRDLYAYKSVAEVQVQLDKIAPVSKRQRHKKDPGYGLIKKYKNVGFYRIWTYEGAKALSADTKWCLANKGDYERHYSKAVILVAVVKARKARERFSKFAIAIENGTVYPWGKHSLPTWADIRDFHLSKTLADEAEFEIYDELDRRLYGDEGHNAYEEVLDLHTGRKNVVREVVGLVVGGQHQGEIDILRGVLADLRKGRSLKAEEFNRVASLVAKHGFFNVVSLFQHPKVRTRMCREHLWSLVDQEALGSQGIEFLVKTPALAVPEAVEVCLGACHRPTRGVYARPPLKKILPLILENKNLTESSKKALHDYIGRNVLKIKDLPL